MQPSRPEFERLALEQTDLLYRMARRLVHDQAKAEDLVQETFLRAFRARESFQLTNYGIRPWLLRIMHNLYLSRGARESRQPVAVDSETLDAARMTDTAPVDFSGFEGLDERIVSALDALPVEYRTVMLLWAVEEFSYQEIANACDIPVGTVMSRLFRARQRLSEKLRDYVVKTGFVRE